MEHKRNEIYRNRNVIYRNGSKYGVIVIFDCTTINENEYSVQYEVEFIKRKKDFKDNKKGKDEKVIKRIRTEKHAIQQYRIDYDECVLQLVGRHTGYSDNNIDNLFQEEGLGYIRAIEGYTELIDTWLEQGILDRDKIERVFIEEKLRNPVNECRMFIANCMNCCLTTDTKPLLLDCSIVISPQLIIPYGLYYRHYTIDTMIVMDEKEKEWLYQMIQDNSNIKMSGLTVYLRKMTLDTAIILELNNELYKENSVIIERGVETEFFKGNGVSVVEKLLNREKMIDEKLLEGLRREYGKGRLLGRAYLDKVKVTINKEKEIVDIQLKYTADSQKIFIHKDVEYEWEGTGERVEFEDYTRK